MTTVADQTSASTGPQEKAAAPPPPSSGPLKTPIASPAASSSVPVLPPLSPDQQSKYDGLLARARAWTEV
ncbi:hypothetical protein LX36DRAFT_713398, partial [Colletotrichum falcatum]